MPKPKQSLVSVVGVAKTFEDFKVFKNVDFSIQRGEKVALVGKNGSGKTTLLEMILGHIKPDAGHIYVAKGISVCYVAQDFDHLADWLVADLLEHTVGKKISQIETELRPLLAKLGLQLGLLKRTVGSLSGGEKTKVNLLPIFLATADLLLLDEPTNNLDAEALQLLANYVNDSRQSFIIVSHDRYFLDQTVTRVLEIDEQDKTTRLYDGNFSDYVEERTAEIGREWKNYQDQAEETNRLASLVEKKKSYIRKIETTRKNIKYLNPKLSEKPDDAILRDKEGRAGRRTKVLKNRLDRFKATEALAKQKRELPLKVALPLSRPSGQQVFVLAGVEKGMPSQKLGPLDLRIEAGNRILITGDNGAGKTTFLKLLMEEMRPEAGSIERGTRVDIGYLPQIVTWPTGLSVREILMQESQLAEPVARRILNRLRLSAEDIQKEASSLSAGERSRLTLALLMVNAPNCLILDEPSNHLDLEALHSFELALVEYKGTLIVVSHDRRFVEQVGFDRVLTLENG